MAEQFDPYHRWLGIAPKDQPPNHYRLLGIDVFEADLDVISDAAEQRMAHVRNYQLGQHMTLSQQILNELAAARVCLLNPQKKAEYDRMLQAKLAPAAAPPVAEPTDSPVAEMDFAPVVHTTHRKQKKGRAWWMPWAFPLLGVAVAAVLLMVIANQGSNEVAKAPSSARPKPQPSPLAKVEAKKEEPKPDPRPEPKIEPQPEPVQPKLTMLDEPKVDPKPESKPELAPAPAPKPEPKAEEPPKKLPVPSATAQEKARGEIRAVYKDDYGKPDKAVLADELLQKAKETQDSTGRFVLLQEAKSVAGEALRAELAFEAIDAMAEGYAVSPIEQKADILQAMAKRPRLSLDQKAAIARAALQVVDEAVGEDNFDMAKKLGRLANQLVRLSKDNDILREIAAKGSQVVAVAKAHAAVQEAMATLKEKPDDAEANLIVGKYQCLNKDNWDKGLPMLAKGSDQKLKRLADKDQNAPTTPKEQVRLGDEWWAVSKGRAKYWYERALPGLTGFEKDRVKKRVATVASTVTRRTNLKSEILAILKSARYLDFINGTWNNDVSSSFNIIKVASGYKVSLNVDDGYYRKLIVFREDPAIYRMNASFTVENGDVQVSFRPRNLAPQGTVNSFAAGRQYDVAFWIANGVARALVNGGFVGISHDDPNNYGCFSFSPSRKCSIVFHQLQFTPRK